MFQISVTKFFLLFLLSVSLVTVWILDSKYYHWEDRILPEHDPLVIETETKPTSNGTSKEFVPTNEWQTIGKDQPIPPGLHVQIDLSSGEKKAKLMEGSNNKINSLAIAHANNSDNVEGADNVPVNLHKFKSYQEIKNDLHELNLTVKSDMELMDELSTKFKEQLKIYEDSDNNLKNILTDLEYLLHQVDTAEMFVKSKGIESIIIPCLNSNSSFLKAQGALLLGSAASNNLKVQIAALEANTITLLLGYISDQYDFSVQKNCLYALSTIIRRFPIAQKQMIEKNGIEILISVFKRSLSDSNMKLKVKVSQLLEDLVVEIEDANLTLSEEINGQLSSEAKERVHQYNELHLIDKLVENDWCQVLGDEFMTLSKSLPENEEGHELVEASGKSLLVMSKPCKVKLQKNKELFNSFYTLERHYKNLVKQDKFFYSLYQLVNQLTNTYDPVLE